MGNAAYALITLGGNLLNSVEKVVPLECKSSGFSTYISTFQPLNGILKINQKI